MVANTWKTFEMNNDERMARTRNINTEAKYSAWVRVCGMMGID